MPVSCPECGSRFINLARKRSARERFDSVVGIHPLRCGDCRTRFIGRTFFWQDLLFAKCPQCFRMDMNIWLQEHLQARGWMAFLLALGGKRLRCEYCRINFVSLRNRKEHFTFNRWTRQQSTRNRNTDDYSQESLRPVSSRRKTGNRAHGG